MTSVTVSMTSATMAVTSATMAVAIGLQESGEQKAGNDHGQGSNGQTGRPSCGHGKSSHRHPHHHVGQHVTTRGHGQLLHCVNQGCHHVFPVLLGVCIVGRVQGGGRRHRCCGNSGQVGE